MAALPNWLGLRAVFMHSFLLSKYGRLASLDRVTESFLLQAVISLRWWEVSLFLQSTTTWAMPIRCSNGSFLSYGYEPCFDCEMLNLQRIKTEQKWLRVNFRCDHVVSDLGFLSTYREFLHVIRIILAPMRIIVFLGTHTFLIRALFLLMAWFEQRTDRAKLHLR